MDQGRLTRRIARAIRRFLTGGRRLSRRAWTDAGRPMFIHFNSDDILLSKVLEKSSSRYKLKFSDLLAVSLQEFA